MANQMVSIFNKGKRTWDLGTELDPKTGEWKDIIHIEPGQSVEMPADVATRYIERYPNEFMEGTVGPIRGTAEVQKLKARIVELETEIATLKKGAGKKPVGEKKE